MPNAGPVIFRKNGTAKELQYYSSYFLAGLPVVMLLFGSSLRTGIDWALAGVLPLHFYIGMRAVVIDTVHQPARQRAALALLAGATALTAMGLVKVNLYDIGVTNAVRSIWIKQDPPKQGDTDTHPPQ